MFQVLLKKIHSEDTESAILILDSFNISNDQFKEHVMDLIMSKELVAKFEKIPTKAKANFT